MSSRSPPDAPLGLAFKDQMRENADAVATEEPYLPVHMVAALPVSDSQIYREDRKHLDLEQEQLEVERQRLELRQKNFELDRQMELDRLRLEAERQRAVNPPPPQHPPAHTTNGIPQPPPQEKALIRIVVAVVSGLLLAGVVVAGVCGAGICRDESSKTPAPSATNLLPSGTPPTSTSSSPLPLPSISSPILTTPTDQPTPSPTDQPMTSLRPVLPPPTTPQPQPAPTVTTPAPFLTTSTTSPQMPSPRPVLPPTPRPQPAPTVTPKSRRDSILPYINSITLTGRTLRYPNKSTTEELALQWLIDDDRNTKESDKLSLRQRYALLTLWFQTKTGFLETEFNYTDTWATDIDECGWLEVYCDDAGRVIFLNLDGEGVQGRIPDDLGLLTAMTELDLSINQLNGTIPLSLGRLTALTRLQLSRNTLTGTIPSSLVSLTALNRLYLFDNDLAGTMPHCSSNKTIQQLIADCDEVTCPCCTHCCPTSKGGIPVSVYCADV